MQAGKTANLLHNCFPIIMFHIIFAFLILVIEVVFRFIGKNIQPNSFLHKLKNNFRWTIFVTCFYLVFNEELLLLLLQYSNVDFSSARNIISFILCLFFTVHFAIMLGFLIRVTFDKNDDLRTKSSKYSMIFTGLKHDNESSFAKYFVILKLAFRAQMVILTFCLYTGGADVQLIPQIVLTSLFILAFLIVRPYVSMFVNLCYIVLYCLYLAIMIHVLVIDHMNPLDTEGKAEKQSQLQSMLLAFFILKNIVIVMDVLLSFKAVWRMIERLKQLARFKRGNVVLMDSKTRAESISMREQSDS